MYFSYAVADLEIVVLDEITIQLLQVTFSLNRKPIV